jgi:hypothetical protein
MRAHHPSASATTPATAIPAFCAFMCFLPLQGPQPLGLPAMSQRSRPDGMAIRHAPGIGHSPHSMQPKLAGNAGRSAVGRVNVGDNLVQAERAERMRENGARCFGGVAAPPERTNEPPDLDLRPM